jgi:uroporphyrinogen-III synthase
MPPKSRSLSSPPLSGWFVVSLRPVGEHRALLHAARVAGATGIALPGLRLRAREDTPTRVALNAALRCPRVIFTSPSAVRSAVRLRTLQTRPRPQIFALGEGTRTALRRAGIADVRVPDEANSERLLAMTDFESVAGARIGLVTAPGGRGLLARRLRERGATLAIAEVYAREPARLNRGHADALLAVHGRGAVCVTSAEALRNVFDALDDRGRTRLLECVAIVSSARLHAIARDAGFARVIDAAGPEPRALIRALAAHAEPQRFR